MAVDWGQSPPRPLTGTGHDPSNRITGWIKVHLGLKVGSIQALFLVADRTSGLLLIGATLFIATSASIDYRPCSLRVPNQHVRIDRADSGKPRFTFAVPPLPLPEVVPTVRLFPNVREAIGYGQKLNLNRSLGRQPSNPTAHVATSRSAVNGHLVLAVSDLSLSSTNDQSKHGQSAVPIAESHPSSSGRALSSCQTLEEHAQVWWDFVSDSDAASSTSDYLARRAHATFVRDVDSDLCVIADVTGARRHQLPDGSNTAVATSQTSLMFGPSQWDVVKCDLSPPLKEGFAFVIRGVQSPYLGLPDVAFSYDPAAPLVILAPVRNAHSRQVHVSRQDATFYGYHIKADLLDIRGNASAYETTSRTAKDPDFDSPRSTAPHERRTAAACFVSADVLDGEAPDQSLMVDRPDPDPPPGTQDPNDTPTKEKMEQAALASSGSLRRILLTITPVVLFFSEIGGFTRGLRACNQVHGTSFRVVLGIDNDPLAFEVHRLNFPTIPTLQRVMA